MRKTAGRFGLTKAEIRVPLLLHAHWPRAAAPPLPVHSSAPAS